MSRLLVALSLAILGLLPAKGSPTETQVTEVNYAIERQHKKCFIGLELRTNNEECSSAMPAHKDRFFRETVLARIPNKISGDILALYTDYEGDYTKPYSWVLGC